MSNYVIHRFRAARVASVSVLVTAFALLGFSEAKFFSQVVLLAIPLGLGAGSIDAALNNFVAVHYEAKHMNWLHCCWGVGATAGPMLMSYFLRREISWRGGYMTVSALQFALLFILLASLKLWETPSGASVETGEKNDKSIVTISETIGIPGIKSACFAFLCYCGFELSTGLWAASYLVERKNMLSPTAAAWASVYYACITAGRFASGFLSAKFPGRALIRGGCILTLAGVAFMFLGPRFFP